MSDISQDKRITAEIFQELSPFEQNEVITAVMEYVQVNDLPYTDMKLYESALRMIEEDNFPVALKIEFVRDV